MEWEVWSKLYTYNQQCETNPRPFIMLLRLTLYPITHMFPQLFWSVEIFMTSYSGPKYHIKSNFTTHRTFIEFQFALTGNDSVMFWSTAIYGAIHNIKQWTFFSFIWLFLEKWNWITPVTIVKILFCDRSICDVVARITYIWSMQEYCYVFLRWNLCLDQIFYLKT